MLTYEEFTEELVTMLPDFLPDDLRTRGVSVEPLVTTNDQHRDVLMPAGSPEGVSGKPLMYLDDAYRQYRKEEMSMEKACGMIAGTLAESMRRIPDVNRIDQQMKPENIFISLINLKENREYLKNIPHLVLGDLAVVYKIPVQDEKMGQGTVTVNKALMERMGLSEEKLFMTAYVNMTTTMPLMVERMQDTLFLDPSSMNGKTSFTFNELDGLETDDCNMFVVSNENRFWGDGFILMKENIEKLSEKLNSSLIIIPSSVHETIVVPDTIPDLVENCLAMVKDVNESTVEPRERLSDSIYRYDRERGELELHTQDGDVRDIRLEHPDEIRETVKNRNGQER